MKIYRLAIKFKYQLLILLILTIGIFLRSYAAYERFDFAHDGDLYSWIVKDIVVNHHFRLIGQLTSTEGVFIGPFFYYLLVPFFILFNMEPVGGIGLSLLIGALTIISFYFIFSKLFSKNVGIIAAFFQAVFLSRVSHDRWIVPTITTSLWEVWYFYVVFMLVRGNFSVFPILGFLTGLIWHINFSEAPILILVPVAIILSRKPPSIKQLSLGAIGFLIPSIPMFGFEFKHNFIQTKAFVNSFLLDQGGGKGIEKLIHVLKEIGTNITGLFFFPFRGDFNLNLVLMLSILIVGFILAIKKIISKKELVLIYIWFLSMVGFFSLSSKIISEYYFSNLEMIFLTIIILAVFFIFKRSPILKVLLILFSIIVVLRNIFYLVNYTDYNLAGYKERKAATNFIDQDSKVKEFPCIAVSYITTPGNNVGFRYLFYLKDLKVNQPISGSPVYTIVIPAHLALESIKAKFGNIGIIPPEKEYDRASVEKTCDKNGNLTDPLFGYVE